MTVGRTPLKKGTNTADEASVRKKVGQQQSEGTLRKRHQPGGGWGLGTMRNGEIQLNSVWPQVLLLLTVEGRQRRKAGVRRGDLITGARPPLTVTCF